jgi:ubiquinone/menaquinone biosynthesis C-methylase UbiE
VRARIWRQVYGPEYPSWADPFSYISLTALRRFARELRVSSGQTLADVGCGRGGPSLWVPAVADARLVGIDVADATLAAARKRAGQVGMASRATFHHASFDSTGLPSNYADAVMSIDVLLFAPASAPPQPASPAASS